ncbi:hypothetical protein ACW7GZ_14405 [Luteimonas sp. A537]
MTTVNAFSREAENCPSACPTVHREFHGGSGKPTIKADESGAAYVTGRLGSGGGMGVGIANFVERLLGDGERYVDVGDFGMELVYKPDRHQLPALETMLRFPASRR